MLAGFFNKRADALYLALPYGNASGARCARMASPRQYHQRGAVSATRQGAQMGGTAVAARLFLLLTCLLQSCHKYKAQKRSAARGSLVFPPIQEQFRAAAPHVLSGFVAFWLLAIGSVQRLQ